MSLPLEYLTDVQLNEFLASNRISPKESRHEKIQQARELFRVPTTNYTPPVIDVYITSQLNRDTIPQSYTAHQIISMKPEEKAVFSQFFSIPLDDPNFDLRMIRILYMLGKLSRGYTNEDYFVLQAFPYPNKPIEDFFPQEPQIPQEEPRDIPSEQEEVEAVEEGEEEEDIDYYDRFEKIIKRGDSQAFLDLSNNPDVYYDMDLMNLFDVAVDEDQKEIAQILFEDIDNAYQDQEVFEDQVNKLIRANLLEWIQEFAKIFIPGIESYHQAISTNDVEMFNYIRSLPMVEPRDQGTDYEREMLEYVTPDKLLKIAIRENSNNIIDLLLQENPQLIGTALILSAQNSDLEKVKKYLPQIDPVNSNELIDLALKETTSKEIFNFFLDQGGFSTEQLNDYLILAAKKMGPEEVRRLIQMGAQSFAEALNAAIIRVDLPIIQVLMKYSPYQPQEIYLSTLHQAIDKLYLNDLEQLIDLAQVDPKAAWTAALIKAIQDPSKAQYNFLIQRLKPSKFPSPSLPSLYDVLLQKPVDLNAALIEAAKLGRIKLMKELISKGATNLNEAYTLADPEKQKWIQREFFP